MPTLHEALDLPQSLIQLNDCLFKELSDERQKTWMREFIAATKDAKDLELVLPKLMLSALQDAADKVSWRSFPRQYGAVKDALLVLDGWVSTGSIDQDAARYVMEMARRATADAALLAAKSEAGAPEAAEASEAAMWAIADPSVVTIKSALRAVARATAWYPNPPKLRLQAWDDAFNAYADELLRLMQY